MFVKKVKNVKNPTEIKHILYIKIKSMAATSGPPIGPILGQYGLPIMSFCDEFNKASKKFKPGVSILVTIFVQNDGEYTFEMNIPGTSELIKRAIKRKKVSGKAGVFFHNFKKQAIADKHGIILSKRNRIFFDRKKNPYYHITPYLLYEMYMYWSANTDRGSLDERRDISRIVNTLDCMGVYVI